MPKEYNLTLEDKTFSGLHKDWEPITEKFTTKLMDNGLEFVADYSQIFFDAMQASQTGSANATQAPSGQTPPVTTPATLTAAERRLANERRRLASSFSAADNDEDEIQPVATASVQQQSPTTTTGPLHPSML